MSLVKKSVSSQYHLANTNTNNISWESNAPLTLHIKLQRRYYAPLRTLVFTLMTLVLFQ
ncbi:hypothetical protein ACHAXS_006934 [Conticribra weissflogii]